MYSLVTQAIKTCLLLHLMCWLCPALGAATLEVCPDGCAYSSIQQAVDAAAAGDSLLIKPGIYREHLILIDKPLSILGQEGAVVDGQYQGEIFRIRANDVSLSGLEIRHVGTSYTEDQAGIRVEKSKNCQIFNNKLSDTFFGIYLAHASNCEIRNNQVIGKAEKEISSGNAIHLWYCKEITVKDNLAKHHRDGIYLEFVENSHILHNVSEDNLRYGLHFMFSDYDDYLHNTFRRNGAGVAVMFSRHIRMQHNRFEENWGPSAYGLLLKEIYDSEITSNVFRKNTVAIYAESATRIRIAQNDFLQNGWAMKMLGSSMDNTITQNNFISNSFDLATDSRRNHNQYEANYWSEYAGYDLDKDGTGDVPYRPVKLYAFIVGESPATIILLRCLLMDLLNYAEKVMPVLTPQTLLDERPRMKPYPRNQSFNP